MPPRLALRASLSGLAPPDAAATLLAPGLARLPAARAELLAALPVVDMNGALLAALPARPPRPGAPRPAGVAVFAADPFLRPADMLPRLRRAGVARVANWPTVQVHDGGDFARGLEAAGHGAAAEARFLAAAAAAGLEAIGYACSLDAARAMLAAGARAVVLHPGMAVDDWRQRAAAGAAVLAAAQALAALGAEGVPVLLHRPAGFGAELDAAAAACAGTVALAAR